MSSLLLKYIERGEKELLAFQPYIKSRDADDRPDEEVANEYWANHIARDDSIIVDVCQGQYKSTLVCPACNKVSITFDPFMYLSLPLQSATTRSMTMTVFTGDGSALPAAYTVTVPKQGRCRDLIQALSGGGPIMGDLWALKGLIKDGTSSSTAAAAICFLQCQLRYPLPHHRRPPQASHLRRHSLSPQRPHDVAGASAACKGRRRRCHRNMSSGTYYFEGRYDLIKFCKIVQQAGMYLILRIGPFVAAEWNFGFHLRWGCREILYDKSADGDVLWWWDCEPFVDNVLKSWLYLAF